MPLVFSKTIFNVIHDAKSTSPWTKTWRGIPLRRKREGDLSDEQKGKHQKLRMGCHHRSTTAAPTLLARNCDTGLHFRIEAGRQAIREDEQEDIITSPWAAMATDGLAKPTATTAIEEIREETATDFQDDAKTVTSSVVGSQSSQ
jgi:hypothetical protein